jgi:AbrB family looped-hinge helix DNA binding protein
MSRMLESIVRLILVRQDIILLGMKTTFSTKGQIILPAEIRQRDGIESGQEFELERIDRGEYRLKRKERYSTSHPTEFTPKPYQHPSVRSYSSSKSR